MELTGQNVSEVFKQCFFDEGEDTSGHIVAEGVMVKVAFDPKRVQAQKENIISMLDQLPDEFKESSGGGWSFLNACNTKDDKQWADLHQTVDELVCLGKAIGKLKFTLPREFWSSLPGGMPYFIFLDKQVHEQKEATS